ncbi:hypothetical protein ACVWY1_000623 [Pseudomonas sp. TE6288]
MSDTSRLLSSTNGSYGSIAVSRAIASSISSEHALQWLVLTDKVRLLVDNYEGDPVSDDYKPIHVFGSRRSEIDETAIDFLEYESSINGFRGSLQIGVLEYLEPVRNWISPVPANDPSNAPTEIEGQYEVTSPETQAG